MNLPYYISQKLNQGKNAKLIVRIAVAGVALGLAVMLVAMAIITGFKVEIRQKMTNFSGDIHIGAYTTEGLNPSKGVVLNDGLSTSLKQHTFIKHYQGTIQRIGILQYRKLIEPVVIKGAAENFEPKFFENNILEGKIPDFKDSSQKYNVLISKYMSLRLGLKIGDKVTACFADQNLKVRRLKVVGIYETGIEDLDKAIAITSVTWLQQLNNWDKETYGYIEVFTDNFDDNDLYISQINGSLPLQLSATSLTYIFPQIFDWLNLLDVNTTIIIVLMLIVAAINMISALLILILEQTPSIGIIKAIGGNNGFLQKIFLYKILKLIGLGMLIGNAIGLGFCFLQAQYHLVPLSSASYYLSSVPILISWPSVILLNVLTLIFCGLAMLLPVRIVSSISPSEVVKYQ